MNVKISVVAMLFAMSASTAIAQSAEPANANGVASSGGVAFRASEQGTLHPGHVAVFATGKNGELKYNKPAFDFHEDGTPYTSGPGGYGAQQSGRLQN